MVMLGYPPHTIIKMPALSPTMTAGNIGSFLKAVPSKINAGDPLVEIETDKATMELEVQEEGFLAKILVKEGEKEVSVGTPLAVLAENQKDVDAFKEYQISEAERGEVKAAAVQKEEFKETRPTESVSEKKTESIKDREQHRIFASPLAKSIASQQGIDLSSISGSGPNGRIVKADLTASMVAQGPSRNVESQGQPYRDMPLSQMRKVIANRLTDSKQSIPHYYLTSEIRMDSLLS